MIGEPSATGALCFMPLNLPTAGQRHINFVGHFACSQREAAFTLMPFGNFPWPTKDRDG